MAEEEKGAAAAPKKKAEKKEGLTKRPSALKRDLQSEKRRTKNRSFRSSVQTAVRTLEDLISKKESVDAIKLHLDSIYSLVDKGVKRGIFKSQKASRTKSRLAKRLTKI